MKLKKKTKFFLCQFVLTFQIVNWVTKLEAPHLEKPQSPILKKSNVDGWNWKKKLYKKIQNRTKLEIKKNIWEDIIESEIEGENWKEK
jgi:hypothetical protein